MCEHPKVHWMIFSMTGDKLDAQATCGVCLADITNIYLMSDSEYVKFDPESDPTQLSNYWREGGPGGICE